MIVRKILSAAATGGIGYYPVGNPTDAYYDNVSLLLNGDVEVDSNFANVSLLLDGNTLTDKSNNKATITNTGSVTVSSAVKKFGTGSMAFSGSNYLSMPHTTAHDFGSGNFTLEGWVYLTSTATQHIISQWASSGYGFTMLVYNGVLSFAYTTNGGAGTLVISQSTYTAVTNSWVYYTITRNGNNLLFFADGILKTTNNLTTALPVVTTPLEIGRNGDGASYFTGYADDLRITKGVARYTSSFTPPVKALPSHEILDSSVYRLPVTTYGNARIDTATKKFGTGAMYFDGSGDYLSTPAGSSMNISSGDFTIEAWVYYTSPQQSKTCTLFHLSQGGDPGFHMHRNTSGYLAIDDGSVGTTPGTIVIPLDTWVHVAAVRISGQIYGYVNGVQCINAATQVYVAPNVAIVGRYNNAGSTSDFKGYLYDARITKGYARYTANFTPPSASLPTIPPTISADPWWGNVSLLLDGNTTDAYDPYWQNVSLMLTGDDFIDWSNQHNAVTNNGTVTLDTTNKKYNSSSYLFSGSGCNLTFPSNLAMNLTDDFTIEFWAKPTSLSNATYPIILGSGATGWGAGCVGINFHGSAGTQGKLVMFTYETSGAAIVGSTTLATVGAWHHYAITRTGTSVKLYVDGFLESTGTSSQTFAFNTTKTFIGANGWDPSSTAQYNGYLADLRITKGIARTITVPTTALPSYKIQDRTQNNLTLTPYGNVQLSTDVMKNGTGSMFFDGTGDYLTLPMSSNLQLGSGQFTVECWFYATNVTSSTALFGCYRVTSYPGNTAGWDIVFASGNVAFRWGSPAYNDNGSTAVTANQWHHIAVVNTGSNIRMYVDGVQATSTTTNATVTNSAESTLWIGWAGSLSGTTINPFNGYIDDLRITKGYARYTQNFTPPSQSFATQYISTGYDANYADVSLLLNGNGTNGSQVFTDLSSNTKAFTNNGVTVNTTTKKYGTGSLSFNGSSNYILVGTNDASFNFGSGDFTMETWFNVPTLPNTYTRIITNFDGVVADPYTHEGPQIEISNTNKLTCRFGFADGTFADLTGSTPITANIWNHVALVRQGTSVKMYLNGVSEGSITVSQAQYWNSNIKTIIGAWYINGSYTRFFNGYIDDFRITKGIARYTSNFTPPTYQLPTDTTGTVIDPLRSSTSLLLRGNGTNGSTSFTDESPNGLTVTNNGSVTVNTTTKKYGTGSMAFSGSNSLAITSASNLSFGTNDFTVEFWFYANSSASYDTFFSTTLNYSGSSDLRINTNSSARTIQVATNNTLLFAGNTAFTLSVWNHLAIARYGTKLVLFLNGVNVGSVTNSTNFVSDTFLIGSVASSYYFNGYIDDLRITKGYARYTSNFTPPTYEDPIVTGTVYDYNYPQVSLLLNGDGTNGSTVFKDLSSSPKTITNNSSVTVNTTTKKFGTGSMAFSGSNYLTVPANNGCVFGTGDFTVEGWYNITSHGSMGTMLWNHNTASTGHPYMMVIGNKFAFGNTGNYPFVIGAITLSLNTWYHLAISRSSGSLKLFVNGVLDVTASAAADYSTSNPIGIFTNLPSDNNWTGTGYADDVRVTKGLARYTQNFTPPTAPLPTSYS